MWVEQKDSKMLNMEIIGCAMEQPVGECATGFFMFADIKFTKIAWYNRARIV
jgi:hypothetical protein